MARVDFENIPQYRNFIIIFCPLVGPYPIPSQTIPWYMQPLLSVLFGRRGVSQSVPLHMTSYPGAFMVTIER